MAALLAFVVWRYCWRCCYRSRCWRLPLAELLALLLAERLALAELLALLLAFAVVGDCCVGVAVGVLIESGWNILWCQRNNERELFSF